MSTQSEAGRTWSSRPSSSDRESQLDPGSRSPSAGPIEGNNTATIISMSSSPGEDLGDERQTVDLLHLWTRTTPHSSEAEAGPEKTKHDGYSRALPDLPPRGPFASDLQNPPKINVVPTQIEKGALSSLEDSSRSEPPNHTGRSTSQSGAMAPCISPYTASPNLVRQAPITTNNTYSNPVAPQRAPSAEEIFPNIYMMEETRAFYGDKVPPFAMTNKIYKAGFHYHAGGPDDPGGLGYRFTDLEMKNLQVLFGSLVTSPINKIFWTPWNEHYNFHVMHLGGISVIVRSQGSKQTPWMGPHKQFDKLCVGHGFRNKGNSTLYKHHPKGQEIPHSAPRGSNKGDNSIQIQQYPNAPTSSLNAASKRRRTLGEDDTEGEDEDGLYSPDRPRRTKRVARPPQSSTHPNGGTLHSFSDPRRKSGKRHYSMAKRLASAAQRKANNVINTPASRASAQTAHVPINPPRPQVPGTNDDLTAGLSNQKLSKTRLHISLSTNNYGSVPVYLKSCRTMESFFDTCFDAWDLHDKATQIGAITATLSWLPKNDQTMVVMRKIPDSYQYLLDAIDKAPCWEEGGESATCDVRVKVIMESGAGGTRY